MKKVVLGAAAAVLLMSANAMAEENYTYRPYVGLDYVYSNANAEGRYLFETFSPLTNRSNLALTYEWNSMTKIQQFQVKSGTTMITGAVASQTSFGAQYIGGAIQWFINNLEDLIRCQ